LFNSEKPSTREIAVMYYLDSMTYEEVARETGLSVSGVRKRLRNLKLKAQHLEGVEYA
jgi:RNA polymerase sigma-70 factor (ECF subfamily)